MATKDKDEGPAIEHSQAGEVAVDKAVSEHRRKIIKASAAIVPAIMTIRSGAAVAMTSINYCVERDAALPAATSVVSAPDEMARVYGWQVITEGEMDEETGVEEPSTTYYCVQNDTTEGWVCFDADGDSTTDQKVNSLVNQINNNTDNATEVYLLACVDAESGAYTWYPQSCSIYSERDVMISGSQITGSCLCSVNPDVANLF